mmetsp:Transcript_35595/g.82663  ORF Transcript_35595/g.82663 Transcript_35595/m.82663 type:complete len:367 (+) Transcript_35595:560-1660(+)
MLVRQDDFGACRGVVQHQLLGVVVQEEATVGELRVHEEEALEVFRGVCSGCHGVVHHVHPEVRHRLMESCAARPLRSLGVRDEVADPIEDEGHALPAAMPVQQQPSNAEMRTMVPRVQRVVFQLTEELVVVGVLALQPLNQEFFFAPGFALFLCFWRRPGWGWRPTSATAATTAVTSSSPAIEPLAKPIQPLVEAFTGSGTRALQEPRALPQSVQSELVRDLCRGSSVRQILLVRVHKQQSVPQLILVQHLTQLLTSILHALAVVAVHHADKRVCALEVVAPERSNLVTATHIPTGQLHALVFYGFNVEANGGDGGDHLSQFQLVQHGSFSGCIQSDYQDPALHLPKDARDHLRDDGHGACNAKLS